MLETVQNSTYLRSKITSDGNSNTDIVSRIAQDKAAFYKKNLFTTVTIKVWTQKKHLHKALCGA